MLNAQYDFSLHWQLPCSIQDLIETFKISDVNDTRLPFISFEIFPPCVGDDMLLVRVELTSTIPPFTRSER